MWREDRVYVGKGRVECVEGRVECGGMCGMCEHK